MDYVQEKKRRTREVFVPLSHPPGHAQVDFGEAVGVIGGVKRKLHYFAMVLPHSDALDSQIAAHIHRHLTEKGVPVLSVHDSYIIDHLRVAELLDVMAEASKTVIGR